VRTYDILGSVIEKPVEGGQIGLPYTLFVVKVVKEWDFFQQDIYMLPEVLVTDDQILV
jgi:hypothetical protein